MVDDARRCTAKSKQSGERCKRPAAPGKRVCYMHGARGGGVKGNLNAMIHGAYVTRVLNAEEQEIHALFVTQLHRDFELNDSSDEISAQMAAMAFVQYVRALKGGDAKSADILDGMVLRHLKSLKATKITREGDGKEQTTTPAQWAAELLKEVRTASASDDAKRRERSTEKPEKASADDDGKGGKQATDKPGEARDADRTEK